jgi:hypothetical protein
MNNTTGSGGILDVLSGKDSFKIDVSIDVKSIVIISAAIFLAVLGAVIISKQV